uniref:Uncharacterized protein n=1 Tax=Oryza barthii TaxID=65489 RepID=A0A0D3G2D8_9ORYZ
MQDHVVVQQRSGDQPAPSCDIAADEIPVNGHKPGRAVTASVYRAKIAGHSRVLTVSWSRDMLSHSFAVSVTGVDGASAECRVDLRPWQFWRRAGSRRVELAGTAPATVRVMWDLRRARFGAGLPEPRSGYYVAVGGRGRGGAGGRRHAEGRAPARVAARGARGVRRRSPWRGREHVFGKRRFAAKGAVPRTRGTVHDIAIEGNQSVTFSRAKVEIYWDVHDWLFSAGMRPALFIFRPIVLSSASAPAAAMLLDGSPPPPPATGFCLYLYAWKLD